MTETDQLVVWLGSVEAFSAPIALAGAIAFFVVCRGWVRRLGRSLRW